ncbi:MAG TPA: response regulator transcription factor [Bacteriovoracaceae bacterium]|nr:response regulator transcription factor [Bacteriovoracaceae bacterium]
MKSNYQVVWVDDDMDLLEAVSLNLQDEFNVKGFTDPEGAVKFIQDNPTDAIVLDYHIPGRNAYDVFKDLRMKKVRQPVLFLTGDTDVNIKLNCLDLGVDDFLLKPISTEEFSAHLRNRIRAFRHKNPTTIKLKNLEMNLSDPLVTLDGRQIALTPKEFQILSMLASNPNTVVRKTEIVEKLWPEVKVEENNVDTHISNLRKKLAGFSSDIKTVKCFGYILKV